MSTTRRAWGAVSTTVACVMPVFLVGGMAVQISGELNFSPAGLGLSFAVYFGVSAVTSVPAGIIVERYGPTMTARAGIVLAASSLLAIAVAARNFPTLLGLLAAGAAANSLGQLAANASLSRVPTRRLGLSFGTKQAAVPAATLLAGLSVPAVALTIGWRWAFVIAALGAIAALPLVPRDPIHPVRRAGDSTATPDRATAALVVIGLAVALAAGAAGSFGAFLVDAGVARGLDPGLAGLVLTLGSVACIAGRIGGGWLADRRHAHGDFGTVAALLAVGSVGLVLVAAPGPVAFGLGVLLGMGLGWAFPGLVNLAVVQLHPHAPAAATSITQTGVYTGGCLGPLLIGTVAAHSGYPTALLGAAGAILAASALTLLGRRMMITARRGQHTAASASPPPPPDHQ